MLKSSSVWWFGRGTSLELLRRRFEGVRASLAFRVEISSLFGLLLAALTGAASSFDFGRVGLDVFAPGVAATFGFSFAGLLSGLRVLVCEAALGGLRSAYGSAVAGRANSGRRGLIAGRIGAEDRDERDAPVGTVRTLDVVFAAGVR